MQFTNILAERISTILTTLGEVDHPLLAYRVALLKQDVNPIIKALQAARVPSSGFQEFTKKHKEISDQNAKKDTKGRPIKKRVAVPAQNGWVDEYDIEDLDEHQKAMSILEEEYKEVLLVEAQRQQDVVMLLNEPVELEFKHKIKYSWCKAVLTKGNTLSLLLDSGILIMDEEPEEDAPSELEEEKE